MLLRIGVLLATEQKNRGKHHPNAEPGETLIHPTELIDGGDDPAGSLSLHPLNNQAT